MSAGNPASREQRNTSAGPTPPGVLLTRVPVLDRQRATYGYDIRCDAADTAMADRPVVSAGHDALLHTILNVLGFDELADDKQLLVPVSAAALIAGDVRLLPREATVLGVAYEALRAAQVLGAVRGLAGEGYRLGLSVTGPVSELVLEQLTPCLVCTELPILLEHAEALPAQVNAVGAKLLVSGIENHADADRAAELGADLMSGGFIASPTEVTPRALAGNEVTRLRLLAMLNQPELDMDELEGLLRCDIELPCGLLRYLNSPAVGMRCKITSLRHAMNLLGAEAMRRWCAVAVAGAMHQGKPPELMTTTLVRARFCENLADATGDGSRSLDYFMVGLLSSIEALLGVPLASAIEKVPLSDETRQALLGDRSGSLGHALGLVLACEAGAWTTVASHSLTFGLTQSEVAVAYFDAVRWVAGQTSHAHAA